MDHFKVNVVGPLVLFQAMEGLLRASSSSSAGSTGRLIPFKVGAYGVSKAAVNHLAVKLQQENPDLIILPLWYVPLPLYLNLTYCKGGADDQARGWYILIWEPR
jgi:hypothetical protein